MNPDSTDGFLQEYLAFPSRFNPTHFDAGSWVRLARAAGQKYIVFTTKHHDGFAMFDAANMTDYKITTTPYRKDAFAKLAQAAQEEQMPLGIYYSPPDMHHPGYRDTSRPPRENWTGQPERPEWKSYLDYMEQHLRQLLTGYGKISVVWFDGLVDRLDHKEAYEGDRFVGLIRKLQPQALINNRIGVPGDFDTPEQVIPQVPQNSRPWETCMTINDSWAYNGADRNFKSSKALLWDLVDVVSRGGNFLLDVGPDAAGTVQPEFESRLREIGAWLQENGEAIYGTRPGPSLKNPNLRTTQRKNVFYVHIMDETINGSLRLDGIPCKVEQAWLLSNHRKLNLHIHASVPTINLPQVMRNQIIPVIGLRCVPAGV
jgi:alpha-L-fucosidase